MTFPGNIYNDFVFAENTHFRLAILQDNGLRLPLYILLNNFFRFVLILTLLRFSLCIWSRGERKWIVSGNPSVIQLDVDPAF